MATNGEDGAPAEAAGIAQGSLPASQLPWQQIPSFDPQTTDVQVYARKMQFLKSIWPKEHVSQLAPRAALQVEGIAFQKIARLDAEKLRSEEGVRYLVEALGGQWGKLANEMKLSLFERAFYQTLQKSDESNDSYLARHDVAFEDLMAYKVSLEEVRAYVLLRQSQLSGEDRKKIIMESKGLLTYEEARKSLRLLGARFFQELQGGSKHPAKTKTYDLNVHEAQEETAMMASEPDYFDEESAFQALYDAGDEYAAFINDFEETVIDTLQESPELASCFTTYLEARTRLKERAKIRGFWPMQSMGQKGRGKKGKGFKGGGKSKSLAERIANSVCRRCLQYGHWKRECPNPPANRSSFAAKGQSGAPIGTPETISIAEALQMHHDDPDDTVEMLSDLPEDTMDLGQDEQNVSNCCQGNPRTVKSNETMAVLFGEVEHETVPGTSNLLGERFQEKMHNRLLKCCRKYGHLSQLTRAAPTTPDPETTVSTKSEPISPEVVLVCEERADEAVIDTGASRTVIGEDRLSGLVQGLTGDLVSSIKKVASSVNFRFGNSGTLRSSFAILIPRREKGWIRVEVVPGRTPFLISNSILKELGALIDPRNQVLRFLDSELIVPLKSCRRNLLCVKVLDLLQITDPSHKEHAAEEIYQQEMHKTDQRENREQQNRQENNHKDTSNIPPLQKQPLMMTHVVQKSPTTSVVDSTAPAALTSQAKWPSVISVSADATLSHEHSNRHIHRNELSGDGTLRRRGSEPSLHQDLHVSPGQELPDATRSEDTPTMGRDCDSLRQASRSDLQDDLREGEGLCVPNSKSESSVCMALQLSELHRGSREVPSKVSSTHSTRDISSASSQAGVHEEDTCEDLNHEQRMASHRPDLQESEVSTGQEISRPDGQRIQHSNADGGQPSSSDRAADSNCIAPKRAGSRDSSPARRCVKPPLQLLDDEQVQKLQKKVEQFIGTISENFQEMNQKHPSVQLNRLANSKYPRSRPVDLLEVYCESNSQITQQIQRFGGRAMRFTKLDGDLNTEEGINKLWTWILLYEPRHVWVAPECKLWGAFSRFNMGRSETTHQNILQGRLEDLPHLHLCNQIYLHQVAMGHHFHLEQPIGSEMIKQPPLYDVYTGTLPAFFDMCQAGLLKAPNSQKYLRKRTQVWTTSRIFHQQLHNFNCDKQHEHQPIQGNYKNPKTQRWEKVSAYAAAYTAVFGRKVAKSVCMSIQQQEDPLIMEELLVGDASKKGVKRQQAQEVLKLRQCRRRLGTKTPPTEDDSLRESGPTVSEWKELFSEFEKDTPRVGNAYFHVGDPRIEKMQQKFFSVEVKMVLMCRGTERHRVPRADISRDDIPLRKTVIVNRQSGVIEDQGNFEQWQRLSKAKQVRKAGPAKISMSIFGKRQGWSSGSSSSRVPAVEGESRAPLGSQIPEQSVDVPMVPSSMENPVEPRISEKSTHDMETISGWPPKIIPVHGPAFRALSAQQKTDLNRLHRNLGHPDPARLHRLLVDQGADPAVIAGALDMQCDVCHETNKKPKLPHPSSIHDDLDFNDVVGADGAHWKSKLGQTYHFMHFIDESTLFHVGAPSGRTTEEQIQTFENVWLHWAGPCKTLYLDPAGEYVSPAWNDHLQKETSKLLWQQATVTGKSAGQRFMVEL